MNMTPRLVLTRALTYPPQSIVMQAFWIVTFAAATAVGARFEIPHQPVPYTLQTLIVLLSGAFLGARNGVMSQLLYLGIGALGAPVFASGSIGIAKLVGPTGGYLLAFPMAAGIVGYLVAQHRSFVWILFSMLVGLVLLFLSGTLHLWAFYVKDFWSAFTAGFLVFSWWDLLKLLAAATVYNEARKRWPRLPR